MDAFLLKQTFSNDDVSMGNCLKVSSMGILLPFSRHFPLNLSLNRDDYEQPLFSTLHAKNVKTSNL
ncbi:hypothetical protein Hanom_Chr09g00831091 [Helianthus anomalus]